MTLYIYDRASNKTYEFHYEDAIVNGEYVYLGRASADKQQVWQSRNVDIEASEDDWVYIVMKDGSTKQVRGFHGYMPYLAVIPHK
jgi:hypothetical protein